MKKAVLSFLLMIIVTRSEFCHAAMGDVIKQFAPPAWGSRGLEWDGTYLWNSNSVTDMVYKIDPSNGSVLDSFASANINPWDMTFVGNELWNVDGFTRSFYSVNPGSGPPWTLEFSKPGQDFNGLTYDGTSLWGSDFNTDMIYEMDLSGSVTSSFNSPGIGPSGLAWDGTYLWNADTNTDLIYKIDPATGNVLDSFSAPGNDPMGLSFDGQYLWHTDPITNQIYQLDAGYSAPVGATPAPPGLATLLSMLGGLGGWRAIAAARLKRRNKSDDA